MNEHEKNSTSNALLEQLVYIDTFVNSNGSGSGELTPNFNVDSQLSLDLAAFADDSFIFPDEDKPKLDSDDEGNGNGNGDFKDHDDVHHHDHHNLINPDRFRHIKKEEGPSTGKNHHGTRDLNPDISSLPKFPVPPGAKDSLVSAGLSTNQIDLISALVAQHQHRLGNSIPENPSTNSSPLPYHNTPKLPSQNYYGNSHVNGNGQGHAQGQAQGQGFFLGNLLDEQIPQLTSSSSSFLSAALSPNLNQTISPNYSDETLTNTSTGGQTPNNASEFDKRRRNTAALARFRIKKKIKEQQMESKIQQLNNVIKDYELKIQQFDMENKLLRNLILEKGTRKSEDELQALKEKAKRN